MKKFLISVLVLTLSANSFAQTDKANKDEKSPENNIPRSDDSLYLESTVVGDKEQPTVSYFIPWKGTGTPDKLNWNIEQKNDKTLDLIDRDIMVRSMSIYNELDMENAAPVE